MFKCQHVKILLYMCKHVCIWFRVRVYVKMIENTQTVHIQIDNLFLQVLILTRGASSLFLFMVTLLFWDIVQPSSVKATGLLQILLTSHQHTPKLCLLTNMHNLPLTLSMFSWFDYANKQLYMILVYSGWQKHNVKMRTVYTCKETWMQISSQSIS